jgi:WD40 repeat protein
MPCSSFSRVVALLLLWGGTAAAGPSGARTAASKDREDPLPAGALYRLGTRDYRHSEPVQAVAYSPDGKVLASASDDNTVRTWEAATGKEQRRAGPFTTPRALAFSPDGRQLLIGDESGVWLWKHAGEEKPRCISPSDQLDVLPPMRAGPPVRMQVTGVDWSADGNWVAWADCCGTVKARRLRDNHELLCARGTPALLAGGTGKVVFAPNSKTLACSADDNSVRLYDLATGKAKARLDGHTAEVTGVVFSPDGKTLVTTSTDGTLRWWRAASGETLRVCDCPGGRSVTFARTGVRLASGGDDGVIRLWAFPSGKLVRTIQAQWSGVLCLALSPDGTAVAAGGEDEAVRVWAVDTGVEFGRRGHTARVWSLGFAPGGKVLASAGGDGSVLLWDLATGTTVASCSGHRGGVRALVYSPAGDWLASGGDDGTIRFWQAATGKPSRSVTAHEGRVYLLAFCQRGRSLASVGADARLRLWHIPSAKSLGGLLLKSRVAGLAGSVKGEEVLFVDAESVNVWNPRDQERKAVAHGREGSSAITCSADGRLFAVAFNAYPEEPRLRVYETASGKLVQDIPGQARRVTYSCIAFLGADVVACGASDGRIRSWHLPTRKWLATLDTQAGGVLSLASSEDGKMFASGNCDSTVLVWPTSRLHSQQGARDAKEPDRKER